MKNGIWKKYERTIWGKQTNNERLTYNELYDNLKNSDKKWSIAKDYTSCINELCGELYVNEGISAGDIYVYYINDDGNMSPEFYIKVTEYIDRTTKEKRNLITINGCSLVCDEVDNKYLEVLISKLYEIDPIKNKLYIEKLEIRNKNYQRLLSLQSKESFAEEELLFLYYMAYEKNDNLAIYIVKDRNIQKDYESFSDNNKVKLFLSIRNSKVSNQLCINSKEILTALAQNRTLKQLNNATKDIISNREYIISLLESFFAADKCAIYSSELEYLPSEYQKDIEVLELIFYNYTTLVNDTIAEWIKSVNNSKEIVTNPCFAHRLIDSFTRSLINEREHYYENDLLWLFSNDILNNLENHILIGPEPTEEREQLKDISINALRKQKARVLDKRKK